MGEYVGPRRIDAFMGYALARWHREQEETAYRIYMSDSVNAYAQGKYLQARYWELLHPRKVEDAADVVASVVERAGLVMISEPIGPCGNDQGGGPGL